jgi:hypothetical protein
MGFFSWKTQDTDRSIPSSYSNRATFPVVMHDNKGHQWIEKNYEGYGVFGGKDYYELLAEMNGAKTREEGIDLDCGTAGAVKFPNLTETLDWEWDQSAPEDCEYQGYFYEHEEGD